MTKKSLEKSSGKPFLRKVSPDNTFLIVCIHSACNTFFLFLLGIDEHIVYSADSLGKVALAYADYNVQLA